MAGATPDSNERTVNRARPDDPIELLVRQAAEVIKAEGRPKAAADVLKALNAKRRSKPAVLFAGEDKRGKSSLVNALLGRPDLSPIGVEVTTGTPISFLKSEHDRARVLHYGEREPVEVPFDEARRLATIQGNPQNEANIRSVQLGIDHPLLDKVVLVDTPGVGGLNSGHAELTLQSLAGADALVFVVDSGAQFRAAELDFLKRATARIETVILVLTKTDLHRGWRTILEDNLKILKEQAPRFADQQVVPVSSLLALRALTCDDPEDAAALREESGIAELESRIGDEVIERSDVLADANRLRSVAGPLAGAERAIREKIEAVNGTPAGSEDLAREQARLKELASDKAEWPRRLDSETRRITLLRSESLSSGLAELRRRYDERVKEPKKQDMESLPGEYVADLTALAGRLNEDASTALTRVMTSVLDEVESAEVAQAIEQLTSDRLTEQLASIDMGDYGLNHYDRISLLSTFSSGRSLSTFLTGSALGVTTGLSILPGVGIAVGLGLGAVYAYQAFKGKKRSAFGSEFKTWMSEQSSQAQTTMTTTFQRELIDVQDEMRRVVREALAQREEEINDAIKTAKAMKSADVEERTKARTELNERRQKVKDLRAQVGQALAERRLPAASGG